MIQVYETTKAIPYYKPVPLTDLPLLYQREHLFPYASYGDTADKPVLREFRMVVLENDLLRVEVAPELGGRVYSLFDKRIGKEVLFSNPVVKPVRYLPIWAFISGGIEFNFPIAHSPTSIAEVGCTHGQKDGYGFIRVGEREARTGMEWVVELGLLENEGLLIQRTAFRNQTGADHPWMTWTICAVPATESTEYVHPEHEVLIHDHRLAESAWPGDGLNWNRTASEMTAYFWNPGSAPHFGAFQHDQNLGMMHVADPEQLPGKKVWTYGEGRHRSWAEASTEGGRSYAEIESGPLIDQSEKPMFPAGKELRYEEFWIPVHSRSECDEVTLPDFELPPMEDCWLGWQHSEWQSEWERFAAGNGPLPESTVLPGIELEDALRNSLEKGDKGAANALALWLAFRKRPEEALPLVTNRKEELSQWIAGLISLHGLHDPQAAMRHFEAAPQHDPIVVVKLDELYESLGETDKRVQLLAEAPDHRHVIERRAQLALTTGNPEEALRLLSTTTWPFEHQRYVRSTLWKQACGQMGRSEEPVPEFLHEDPLAQFGAYWSD